MLCGLFGVETEACRFELVMSIARALKSLLAFRGGRRVNGVPAGSEVHMGSRLCGTLPCCDSNICTI